MPGLTRGASAVMPVISGSDRPRSVTCSGLPPRAKLAAIRSLSCKAGRRLFAAFAGIRGLRSFEASDAGHLHTAGDLVERLGVELVSSAFRRLGCVAILLGAGIRRHCESSSGVQVWISALRTEARNSSTFARLRSETVSLRNRSRQLERESA